MTPPTPECATLPPERWPLFDEVDRARTEPLWDVVPAGEDLLVVRYDGRPDVEVVRVESYVPLRIESRYGVPLRSLAQLPARALVDDDVLYVVLVAFVSPHYEHEVVALDRDTGAVLARTEVPEIRGATSEVDLVVSEDQVVLVGPQENVFLAESDTVAVWFDRSLHRRRTRTLASETRYVVPIRGSDETHVLIGTGPPPPVLEAFPLSGESAPRRLDVRCIPYRSRMRGAAPCVVNDPAELEETTVALIDARGAIQRSYSYPSTGVFEFRWETDGRIDVLLRGDDRDGAAHLGLGAVGRATFEPVPPPSLSGATSLVASPGHAYGVLDLGSAEGARFRGLACPDDTGVSAELVR